MASSSILFVLYGCTLLFVLLFIPDKIKRRSHFRNAFALWIMALFVMIPVTVLTYTLGRFDTYGLIYIGGAILSWLLVILSLIEFYNAFQTGRRMTVRRGFDQARQTIRSMMEDDSAADRSYRRDEHNPYGGYATESERALAEMQGGHPEHAPQGGYATHTQQVGYAQPAGGAPAQAPASPAPHMAPQPQMQQREHATAAQSIGDLDRAIADYSRAIRLQPDNALAYNNRANAFAVRGDTDAALADYNEAVRLEPNNATLYHNRGLLFAQLGRYDEAIQDQTEAIRLNPGYAAAYNDRGIAYRKKGEPAKADHDFAVASRVK